MRIITLMLALAAGCTAAQAVDIAQVLQRSQQQRLDERLPAAPGSERAQRIQASFARLTALALLSVAGLVTVVTFAWFSAPDLALTQTPSSLLATLFRLELSESISLTR